MMIYEMTANPRIHPMQTVEEHLALSDAETWRWYQRRVDWRHEVIVARDGKRLVGYGAIELGRLRGSGYIVLAALESRRSGVGYALLHALKLRARAILVENVPRGSAAWLERQGFVPPNVQPTRPRELAPDVTGDLIWHRWDDPALQGVPGQPLWPDSVELGHLLTRRPDSEPWDEPWVTQRGWSGSGSE